jgi:16S rRNA (guanine527-N7)-methyltransferase
MTYDELEKALAPEVIITPETIEKFKSYLLLLQEWNEKFNLTKIVEEDEAIEKHFYDSLLPAKSPHFRGDSIADIGTGAGFPGLVYAVVFPKKRITLVEATGKKCKFLEAVVSSLKLSNVTILNKRAEDLTCRESFDLVVARAVAPLNILLEITSPFAKVHGLVLAMKGEKADEEIKEANKAMASLSLKLLDKEVATLPNGESRINLFFIKEGKTFKRYPRMWAEINKKPL